MTAAFASVGRQPEEIAHDGWEYRDPHVGHRGRSASALWTMAVSSRWSWAPEGGPRQLHTRQGLPNGHDSSLEREIGATPELGEIIPTGRVGEVFPNVLNNPEPAEVSQ